MQLDGGTEPHTTSIIIPVWNGAQDLRACLDALLAQSPAPDEVIAVDNASTDGSADLIATVYPQVTLIRHAANLGFSGACNAGMAAGRGDLLVLLNQDTEVQPGWLAELLAAFAADPALGIAGSKALYPDGRIQHAGGYVDAHGLGHHYGYREEDRGQWDAGADVTFVTGASLALRRSLYTQTGGFDPAFAPAYFEDVDLCLHAAALGMGVRYVPGSRLLHKESSTAAAPSHAARVLQYRNRLRLVCKHWSASRLRDEFLPAARAWFAQQAAGNAPLVAAYHEAALLQLLNLGDLAQWRARLLGEDAGAIDTLAEALLTLRSLYPPVTTAGSDALVPALEEAEPLAFIRERPFHSDVPGVGPWIAAFRQAWNRVATEWYVKPMIRDQSRFNAVVVAALRQALDTRQRDQEAHAAQRAMLDEYIAGLGREIGVLSREVEALKRRLDAPARAPNSAPQDRND